jgi:hypothetical protein
LFVQNFILETQVQAFLTLDPSWHTVPKAMVLTAYVIEAQFERARGIVAGKSYAATPRIVWMNRRPEFVKLLRSSPV